MVTSYEIEQGLPRTLCAVWNSLSGKHRRYIVERGNDDAVTQKEACSRARIGAPTASKLEKQDGVHDIIVWIQEQQVAPRHTLTVDRKRELYAGWAEDGDLDVKDRIKAMEADTKLVGDGAAKQIEVNNTHTHTLIEMSDEELNTELKKIGMHDSLDFIDASCTYLPDVSEVALTIVDAEVVEDEVQEEVSTVSKWLQ